MTKIGEVIPRGTRDQSSFIPEKLHKLTPQPQRERLTINCHRQKSTIYDYPYPAPLTLSPATMAPPTPTSISLFAETQLQLLLHEHEAEVASSSLATTAASVSPSTRRTLQATGYALTGLVLSQCRTGMGGRVVGEFAPDPAVSSGSKSQDGDSTKTSDGQPRLGSHGIRVGDVVRVSDVAAGSGKKVGKDKGKDGAKDDSKGGPEGVVTRVGDRAIWIAFGQRGGGGRSKEDDEAVEELWGKKLWAYVLHYSDGKWRDANADFRVKLANDVTYRR